MQRGPDARELAFIEARRVGHLATVDAAGELSVVPVCFAWVDGALVIPIDEKPKRRDRPLQRVRNIAANGRASVIVDQYDEDWSRLGWVLLRGRARLIQPGEPEHAPGIAGLRARYPQYRAMALEVAPLIALAPERVRSWGAL